jgi:hypothetical protein
MSPESGQVAADEPVADVPAEMLDDGEVIILMVRPSGWFVLLESLPVLLAAGALAAGLIIAARGFDLVIPGKLRYLVPGCMVLMLMRLYLASFQWMRRVYILTNRRVLRQRGLLRTEMFECPLENIESAQLEQGKLQRRLNTGDLLFTIPGHPPDAGMWRHVPRPEDVEDLVADAVSRAKR